VDVVAPRIRERDNPVDVPEIRHDMAPACSNM
jgi:hypothetical protein